MGPVVGNSRDKGMRRLREEKRMMIDDDAFFSRRELDEEERENVLWEQTEDFDKQKGGRRAMALFDGDKRQSK